jgi:enoyl-CoA hydratase/carnithine racemase
VALSRAIPPKHALQMLLTGDMISADTALSYGLLNAVVPHHMLEEETSKLAEKISNKSSFGIRLGKQLFYRQLKYNLEDAYDFATERIICNLQHPDAREGIDNFVNKKK